MRGDQVNCSRFSCVCVSLVILFLFILNCAEKPVFREEIFYPKIKHPSVIVKLIETEDSLRVSSPESFTIRCFPSEGEPFIYYASAEIGVKFSQGGITLSQKTQGELETNLCKVSFIPKKDDGWLYLNGKPYRGVLEMILSKNPKSLMALNIIHLEDYLKGVVPAEIGKLNHPGMEALKAQAVAARTYALFCMGQNKDKEYDLESTVADQIYSGAEVEDPLVNQAIKLTKGKVLTYEGKLVCAYYHANCGGKTEYIEKVWDKPKQPYLIQVDDDDFCSWSKNYIWEESWTKDILEENVKIFLDSLQISPKGEFGNLLDLNIKQRSPSGRVELLEVVTDSGTYPIRADKIRWALKKTSNHNSILPSTWFDLEIERENGNSIKRVTARGRGNGHGVGMCQSGAIGMAKAGNSYKDILMHYYPGVKITKCY